MRDMAGIETNTVILKLSGISKFYARIAALTLIADRLQEKVAMVPPPLDPAVLKVAKKALDL